MGIDHELKDQKLDDAEKIMALSPSDLVTQSADINVTKQIPTTKLDRTRHPKEQQKKKSIYHTTNHDAAHAIQTAHKLLPAVKI